MLVNLENHKLIELANLFVVMESVTQQNPVMTETLCRLMDVLILVISKQAIHAQIPPQLPLPFVFAQIFHSLQQLTRPPTPK